MKQLSLISLSLVICALSVSSCKSKAKEPAAADDANSSAPAKKDSEPANTAATTAQPQTFTVTYAPDSLVLGKDREAFVQFTDGQAVTLQDPEGKSTGMEVTFKMRLTNKSTLEAKKFFSLSPGDSRLELDNGTSITYKSDSGTSNPDPEASTEVTWIYDLPAGTKPVKLNLFLNGTRVATNLALTEKK